MTTPETVESLERSASPIEAGTGLRERTLLRRTLGAVGMTLCFGTVGLAGGLVGLGIAANTETHLQLGGTNTSVETTANNYDEVDINQTQAILRQATDRTILGQPAGVKINLDIDTSKFLHADGTLDATLLPAYFSLFSDTKQDTSDISVALKEHAAWDIGYGALAAIALYGTYRWRRRVHYDEAGSAFRKRVAFGMVAASLLYMTPGSEMNVPKPTTLQTDPMLAGTPLANLQIGGLVKPAVSYIEHYIEKYITNTNKYYDALQQKLAEYLTIHPIVIPTGEHIANFGFVTDRHCNIGMDRVIVGLLNAYGIKTLVSAGDDAFSGSFKFETGCTSDLAKRLKKAGIIGAAGGGNHDDKLITDGEKTQGIHVLDDNIIMIHGLYFLGEQDPRQSRYGTGIRPSSVEEQKALLRAQGMRIGEIACKSDKKIFVVLHDPIAGEVAMENGCGNVTLALDGHTHVQRGPTAIDLPIGGSWGYTFTGASAGGAPNGEQARSSSPFEHLTVGPLNHNATVNIISVNTETGQLIGVNSYTFKPDMSISTESQLTPYAKDLMNPTNKIVLQFKTPNSKRVLATAK